MSFARAAASCATWCSRPDSFAAAAVTLEDAARAVRDLKDKDPA